jgi:hypothetical protein
MADPFAGIREKLIRANENIRNLDSEISGFFQKCKYPVIPDFNDKLFREAVEYHTQLELPVRFSVLSGEIVHHLRSCLDHLVWLFSTPDSRLEHFRKLEFPIFDHKPVDKKQIASYAGKIQGITNPSVRNLIERVQPYNSSDYVASPLSIIHHMDVFDKHRELVIHYATGGLKLPAFFRAIVERYQRTHPELNAVQIARIFQSHGQLIPQVAFKDFGGREIEPVAQALMDLYNTIVILIRQFDNLHVL